MVQRLEQPGYKPVNRRPLTDAFRTAQGPYVLIHRSLRKNIPMKRTFKIYRYDPDKDAKPYMQTVEEWNWTATSACCWTP